MHGCTSHEPYTQAQVASAAGRQYVKIQVEAGRDKHIATQQATPMSWHVAPNNQSARRCSETRVSTGSDVDVAICARIAIQNDIDGILALGKSGFVVNGVSLKGILALGKSGFVVNGVSLKVGSRNADFKLANDKIKACSQHLQRPGRLSDPDRDAIRKVATSFFSGSRVCSNTGAHFTDQDCVSYVYFRTLERIKQNKYTNKKKNNEVAGV
jgi:hypothetical protein